MAKLKITFRAARVNVGLNQEEAADKIGIGVAALRNYECYLRQPRWKVVAKMAEVYGVAVDDFSTQRTEDEGALG